jgi:putative hydrolase of HD superfamily
LPEVIKGDPTPHDGIPEHEKLRGETEAMEHLFRNFRDPERYISLWQEYAEQSTPEARFVKQIDRLEMALQASVYERQHGKDLSDFFLDVKTKLHEPVLKGILEEIILIRGR